MKIEVKIHRIKTIGMCHVIYVDGKMVDYFHIDCLPPTGVKMANSFVSGYEKGYQEGFAQGKAELAAMF